MMSFHKQFEYFKHNFSANLGGLDSYLQEFENLFVENVEKVGRIFKNINIKEISMKTEVYGINVKNILIGIISILVIKLFYIKFLSFNKNLENTKKKIVTKNQSKNQTKIQKINEQIKKILDDIEFEHEPKINEFILTYTQFSESDFEDKFKYFQNVLLKELLKLDTLDVSSSSALRKNRRSAIKYIQKIQINLDSIKKV